MREFKDLLTVGTTFNKRLFEHDCTKLWDDMANTYPYLSFRAYHENSFELGKYGDSIEFDEPRENLTLLDLFEVSDSSFHDCLKNSPFNSCHQFGTPGEFDPPYYWKRNSIFWFRKVAALYHAAHEVETPLLLWLGADTYFKKPLDDKVIELALAKDVCYIERGDVLPETDIMIFNLSKGGKDFISNLYNFYISERVFQEERWDDCLAFSMTQRVCSHLSYGNINNSDEIRIYDYIHHYKRPLHKIRDARLGI